MTDLSEQKLKNKVTLKVHSDIPKVVKTCVEFYEKQRNLIFQCPFCNGDIDNLSGEVDGDMFEDTYTCDECDALITLITPHGVEYHNVSRSETTYLIEFMWGGKPTTWPYDDENPDFYKE